MAYHIQFWRGADQIIDYEDDEYLDLDEAQRHIEDLIREMMADAWIEDWTDYHFVLMTEDGRAVLQVPVLAAMSALARRTYH